MYYYVLVCNGHYAASISTDSLYPHCMCNKASVLLHLLFITVAMFLFQCLCREHTVCVLTVSVIVFSFLFCSMSKWPDSSG